MITLTSSHRNHRVSTVKQQDAKFGTTGVGWMERVVNQLEQGILRAMSTGETLIHNDQNQRDMPEFRWEGSDLVMDGSKVTPDDDGDDRFGIDVVLAVKMKWLVANADRSDSLGPRLLLHYPKYPVVADQTGGKAFNVQGLVVFLACSYT